MFYEFLGSALISYAFNLTGASEYGRAIAYSIAYLVAYNISGGHFNPATSLAVMLVQNNIAQDLKYFLLVSLTQLMGCYLGFLITFL